MFFSFFSASPLAPLPKERGIPFFFKTTDSQSFRYLLLKEGRLLPPLGGRLGWGLGNVNILTLQCSKYLLSEQLQSSALVPQAKVSNVKKKAGKTYLGTFRYIQTATKANTTLGSHTARYGCAPPASPMLRPMIASSKKTKESTKPSAI